MPVRPEKPYIFRVFPALRLKSAPQPVSAVPDAAYPRAAVPQPAPANGITDPDTALAELLRLLGRSLETDSDTQAPAVVQRLIRLLIRTYLPGQDNLSMLFNTIAQIKRQRPLQQLVPTPVQAVLDRLEAATAGPARLRDAQEVRRALVESGYFLESRLASGVLVPKTEPANDLKLLLLILQQRLTEAMADSPPTAREGFAPGRRSVPPGAAAAQAETAGPVTAGRQPGDFPDPRRQATGPAPLVAARAAGADPAALQAAVQPGAARALRADTTPPTGTGDRDARRQPLATVDGLRQDTPPPLPDTLPAVRRVANDPAPIYSKDDLLLLLFRQSLAALARMHVAQLSSLADDADNRPLWLFDLPVTTAEGTQLFALRISREEQRRGRKTAGEGKTWSVIVSFDLPATGPTQACIRLDGRLVDITFRTADPHSRALFESHLQLLADGLSAAGLEAGRLLCVTGKEQGSPPYAPSRHDNGYIDEEV